MVGVFDLESKLVIGRSGCKVEDRGGRKYIFKELRIFFLRMGKFTNIP